MAMKSKPAPVRGRPPKRNRHEAQANFTLPQELEDMVIAFQEATKIGTRSEAYRQMVRKAAEQAKKEGLIK